MPVIEPPAISPELKSVAGTQTPIPARLPVVRSTHHRTSPPAKIGAVVAIGR